MNQHDGRCPTLSELFRDVHQVEELAHSAGGELDEEKERALDSLIKALSEKVDGTCVFLSRIDGAIEYWEREAEKPTKIARVLKRSKERLKEYVKSTMIAEEKKEMLGERHGFRLDSGGFKLSENLDEQKLPRSYFQVELKPNKTQIVSDLKKGVAVEGASLERIFRLVPFLRKDLAHGRDSNR